MDLKPRLKEREGESLPLLSVASFFVFFCFLQFNTLPSDQPYVAFPLAIFTLGLVIAPKYWLSTVFRYPKISCLIAIGPLFLFVSALTYSYWPWLSLWMSANFILLPLTVLAVVSFGKLRSIDFISGFTATVTLNSLSMIFLACQGVERPAGFLNDPNLAANFASLGVLSTLFLIQKFSKKVLYLIQFFLGLALFLSLSRGALISLVGALIVYLSLCSYKKIEWLRLFAVSIFVLGFSFFVGTVIQQLAGGEVSSLALTDRPESMSDRFDMWQSSWYMFLEQPIWGSGLGTFALRYPEFRVFSETSSAGFFAHNDYLQLLVELGLVGLVSWFITPVLLFVLCVRSYVRSENSDTAAIHCLSIAVFSLVGAHSFVNFIMYHPLINVFLGCVVSGSIIASFKKPLTLGIPDNGRRAILGIRTLLFTLFLIITISSTADLVSRKTISELRDEIGSEFDVRSEHDYSLLALKYFSPLNVEIRNYIVVAEVNTALGLVGTPFGKNFIDSILSRIDKSSWLQSLNCSQQVSKARLIWPENKSNAIKVLRLLVDELPNCVQARMTLSEALISKRLYAQAISVLNEGIDRLVFREVSGKESVMLIEALIEAYHFAGEPKNALALEAYLNQFKSQQESLQTPEWSRRLRF